MEQLLSARLEPACSDHAALFAAAVPGTALCTIVSIEGAFSRRLGAQLAIRPDGTIVGSLADGCLEKQLASDARSLTAPTVLRYGRGSEKIDFRLPCGGGLDILIDPAPDHSACRAVAAKLTAREPANLPLPYNAHMQRRRFIPALALTAIGEGPELEAMSRIAIAADITATAIKKDQLALGREPDFAVPDRWTASVLLFHDHEWEGPILRHVLSGPAFYVGAQGGETARMKRINNLLADGIDESQVARIRGPIGVIPSCRDPETLALSVLAEITGEYEKLHP